VTPPLVEYGSLLVLVAVEEHHDIACTHVRSR
jgi:hypothetical protein